MSPLVRLALLAAIALGLGACSGVQHRPLDPADRAGIRTIGLLTPAVAQDVDVRMAVHPGRSLGVVGSLWASEDMRDKSADFTRAARSQGFDCSRSFMEQLAAELRQAGYRVQHVAAQRDPQRRAFLSGYPRDDQWIDAYLDLYSDHIGYTAAGGTTPYRPAMRLNVRLVRARDSAVLYQDAIAYNAFGDGDGAVTLQPSPGYEFPGFRALMADPRKALEGLQVAMRETGAALVRLLR